ncbi:MAG TPA: glycosyltransferase family 4 protein, partial [Vicinamibacterales bacterium]
MSRPHNMWCFAEESDAYPERVSGVRIVYDAEALYSLREAKQLELAGTPLSAAEQKMRLQRELDLARSAHAVIAVSALEANTFKAAGVGNMHVLGHALEPEPIAADFADRHDFLFVGALDDDSTPNIDGLFWFIDEVMPHLDRLIGTQYRVRIAGRGGANRLRELVNPRVELLGLVDNLTEQYREARVFIAPARFAAGIPHKLHETGSRGLPAVATRLLATQLGWEDGTHLLVADSPEHFAHQCARLYMDRALWQRLRQAALLRVESDCDPAGFDLKLAEVLRSLEIAAIETRLAGTHLGAVGPVQQGKPVRPDRQSTKSAGRDGEIGQLLRRADELVATLQLAQAKLSRSWYGRQILESGHASLQRKESFRRNLFGDVELRNALAKLEITAANHVEANQFDVALQLINVQAFEIWMRTLAKGWISGSERLDRLCLSIGGEVRGVAERRRPAALPGRRRCVYTVSQLYREGGHTRLLEDLIAAQPRADHQIIWTWGESADAFAKMDDVLRVRKAVPLRVLRGDPVERLRAAFAFLTEFCPDVLVHLGHPNDPITIALMQPGIARRCLMI